MISCLVSLITLPFAFDSNRMGGDDCRSNARFVALECRREGNHRTGVSTSTSRRTKRRSNCAVSLFCEIPTELPKQDLIVLFIKPKLLQESRQRIGRY